MAGPKEQPLPPDVIGRDDATEVLRAFVVDGGLSIAFTRAFEEPDMRGLLIVDIGTHRRVLWVGMGAGRGHGRHVTATSRVVGSRAAT